MTEEKKIRTSLSISPAHQDHVSQKSPNNFSGYIGELIERDIEGRTPSPDDDAPFIDLCRRFAPARTKRFQQWMELYSRTNQALMITTLIDTLALEAETELENMGQVNEDPAHLTTPLISALQNSKAIISHNTMAQTKSDKARPKAAGDS